jgi:hypothetical protein
MKTLLQRVFTTYLSASATAFGHVVTHVDHCPHCHERTTWSVRALAGYVRCQQCGRDPIDRDDQTPMRNGPRNATTPYRAAMAA